ncbi:NAD(P)/FAD-dependent oxidoreductase [Cupriavidus basilensis]
MPEFESEPCLRCDRGGGHALAGLATAVYAASEAALRRGVRRACSPGGQAGASSRIENYPSAFPRGISGQALAEAAPLSRHRNSVLTSRSRWRWPHSHCGEHPPRIELCDGRKIPTRTVVIASGAAYRHPAIAALDRYEGRGVYYWASPVEARLCGGDEAALARGRQLGRTGGGLPGRARAAACTCLSVGRAWSGPACQRYLIERIAAQPNIELHTGARKS